MKKLINFYAWWYSHCIVSCVYMLDKLGITSVIRDLALCLGCYFPILHFFRASSWFLQNIRIRCFHIVRETAPAYKENGLSVLIGDGVKQSKEGGRIPGVKKLFQESEGSARLRISMAICLAALAFWLEVRISGSAFH